MSDAACPICGEGALPVAVPVSVRRGGRTVLRLEVPALRCESCGYVAIEEEVHEEVIAVLERHSEPGDDIVFPVDLEP